MSMIFSILEKFKRTIGWPLGIEIIPYSLPSCYRLDNAHAKMKKIACNPSLPSNSC